MFTRVTEFHLDPSHEAEFRDRQPGVIERLKSVDGVVHISVAWRSSNGTGFTTGIYDSPEAARDASAEVHGIWASLADLMQGPPQAGAYENVTILRE